MTRYIRPAVAACLFGTLAAVFSFYVDLTKPVGSVSKDYCKVQSKCSTFTIEN